jgi:hypothetical protein
MLSGHLVGVDGFVLLFHGGKIIPRKDENDTLEDIC